MEIARRRAIDADREQLRLIHHAAYRDLIERQFGAWDEERANRYFDGDWNAGDVDAILVDDVLAGYCVIRESADGTDVDELVLSPQFQSRGIGTFILRQAIVMARVRRVSVLLRTARLNRAAELYRRLGFVETGSDETHIHFEWRLQ